MPAACTEEENAALKAAVGIKVQHDDGSDCVVDDSGNAYADDACRTLVINLSKPAPYFATVMSLWVTYPAKQENIEEGGDLWWTSTKFQVGNGPFIWQEAEPFVRALFVPNPNFTNGAGVPTYSVEYRYITDGAVQFEAYKNDELDVIAYGGEDVPAIAADPELSAQNFQYAGSCTILLRFSLQGKFTAPDGSDL